MYADDPSAGLNLTDDQKRRIEFARTDLIAARSADLAAMNDANLILQVERLRGRLHDVLRVLDEIAD
jgi:hypothetical protein